MACLMTSCGVYYAQIPDLPMLERQGDLRADACYNAYTEGVYGTLSYAITDHVGIQGNLNAGQSGVACQGAVGCYGTSGRQVFELYTGLGMGATDRPGWWYTHIWGNFNTFFVQGDYGWMGLLNKHLDIGFGLKVGRLMGDSYCSDEDLGYSKLSERTNFIEPVMNIRFGWEHLKFSIRTGMCSSWPTRILIRNDFTVTTVVGLNYYFNIRKKSNSASLPSFQ